MAKFTNDIINESVKCAMIGVGTYMGGHFSISKEPQEVVIKKLGLRASYSEMLEQAQKETSSTLVSKDYSL